MNGLLVDHAARLADTSVQSSAAPRREKRIDCSPNQDIHHHDIGWRWFGDY
jgi:hypothetical protein